MISQVETRTHPVLLAARKALVAVPEPARDTIGVRGGDARSWLNGIVSCDLIGLESGRGAFGLLLTKQGKIQADLDVLASPDGLLLGVSPGLGDSVRDILGRYLVMEDAELEPSPEVGWLRLHGVKAVSTAEALSALPSVLAWGAVDWLGLGGAALAVARDDLTRVAAEAAERAGEGALVAGAADWEILRISCGFPTLGVDFGAEDNPHEASLERRAVSFSKGCYLGQEVVCMQDMRGKVKRRLVPMRLTAGAGSVDRDVVRAGSTESVGQITSLAPDGDTWLAFARLKTPFSEGGTALSAGGWQAEIIAQAERR